MLLIKLKEKFLFKHIKNFTNIIELDKDLIVDVNAVKDVNSASIGTIVYFHTVLQKKKKKLFIFISDKNCEFKRFLKKTELDSVLNIIDQIPNETIHEIFYDQ